MSDGKLRQIFREHLSHFHWQAIESGFTARGIPDMNYCYNGVEGWVENKRTLALQVKISPEQISWHMRRSRAGGLTYVAVRQQKKDVDALWLFRGSDIEELRDSGLRGEVMPIVKTIGGPAKWDWPLIGAALLHHK